MDCFCARLVNAVRQKAMTKSENRRGMSGLYRAKRPRLQVAEEIASTVPFSDSWLRLAASAPLNLKLPAQECSVHQFVCSPVLSGIAVCLLKLIVNLAILCWPATSPSNEHHTDPLTTPTRPRNF